MLIILISVRPMRVSSPYRENKWTWSFFRFRTRPCFDGRGVRSISSQSTGWKDNLDEIRDRRLDAHHRRWCASYLRWWEIISFDMGTFRGNNTKIQNHRKSLSHPIMRALWNHGHCADRGTFSLQFQQYLSAVGTFLISKTRPVEQQKQLPLRNKAGYTAKGAPNHPYKRVNQKA